MKKLFSKIYFILGICFWGLCISPFVIDLSFGNEIILNFGQITYCIFFGGLGIILFIIGMSLKKLNLEIHDTKFIYTNGIGIRKEYMYSDIEKAVFSKKSLKLYTKDKIIKINDLLDYVNLGVSIKKYGIEVVLSYTETTHNAVIRPNLFSRIYALFLFFIISIIWIISILNQSEISNLYYFFAWLLEFLAIYIISVIYARKIVINDEELFLSSICKKIIIYVKDITKIVAKKDSNGHIIYTVYYKNNHSEEDSFSFGKRYENAEILLERFKIEHIKIMNN